MQKVTVWVWAMWRMWWKNTRVKFQWIVNRASAQDLRSHYQSKH